MVNTRMEASQIVCVKLSLTFIRWILLGIGWEMQCQVRMIFSKAIRADLDVRVTSWGFSIN